MVELLESYRICVSRNRSLGGMEERSFGKKQVAEAFGVLRSS